MIIKKKIDAAHFIVHFMDFAKWDETKYYIQLPGVTLMQYEDGTCTYHRKNELFEDIREIEFDREFVWRNRKMINELIKSHQIAKYDGII
jgi:hypothetical protein